MEFSRETDVWDQWGDSVGSLESGLYYCHFSYFEKKKPINDS